MKNQAFTLIELLVVVLIIGILAAIAVPQYQKAVAKSRYSTVKFMTRALAEAQEAFYLAHNYYAQDFDDLDVLIPNAQKDPAVAVRWNYDGGFCQNEINDYASYVVCRDINTKMEYGIRLIYSANSPGAKFCIVRGSVDESEYRNQICKAETGAEHGIDNGTRMVWIYQ